MMFSEMVTSSSLIYSVGRLLFSVTPLINTFWCQFLFEIDMANEGCMEGLSIFLIVNCFFILHKNHKNPNERHTTGNDRVR